MQNVANLVILDSFNIASKYGHNSLIKAPMVMVQDDMECQETALQLSCFEF